MFYTLTIVVSHSLSIVPLPFRFRIYHLFAGYAKVHLLAYSDKIMTIMYFSIHCVMEKKGSFIVLRESFSSQKHSTETWKCIKTKKDKQKRFDKFSLTTPLARAKRVTFYIFLIFFFIVWPSIEWVNDIIKINKSIYSFK